MKVTKILIHPGEINSFKCWPNNRRVIASHSDHNELFLWDMDQQPCMQSKHKQEPSFPNLILMGHTAQPTYALNWCKQAPLLASGSNNGNILIWNLENHLDFAKGIIVEQKQSEPDPMSLQNGGTKLTRNIKQELIAQAKVKQQDSSGSQDQQMSSSSDAEMSDSEGSSDGNGKKKKTLNRNLKNIQSYLNDPKPDKRKQSQFKNSMTLRGHTASVEDLCFKASSKDVLCSVGVDRKLLIWDLRQIEKPSLSLEEIHSSDINTVDWCQLDENLIATGSNDCLVKVFDIRKAQ